MGGEPVRIHLSVQLFMGKTLLGGGRVVHVQDKMLRNWSNSIKTAKHKYIILHWVFFFKKGLYWCYLIVLISRAKNAQRARQNDMPTGPTQPDPVNNRRVRILIGLIIIFFLYGLLSLMKGFHLSLVLTPFFFWCSIPKCIFCKHCITAKTMNISLAHVLLILKLYWVMGGGDLCI